MVPVESIPVMGKGRERRIMEGVNSSMIHLIYCKNFCGCHNAPSPSTIKKIYKIKKKIEP
jgi:hypothetical protein